MVICRSPAGHRADAARWGSRSADFALRVIRAGPLGLAALMLLVPGGGIGPPRPGRNSSARRRAVRELLVIAVLYGIYKLGRLVAAQNVASAFDNAYVIWDLERLLRLPDEVSLQALTLQSTVLTKAANIYYAGVHFPATIGFLLWLYLRRPADYRWLRRALATLTGAGLLLHLAVPVAPPRMLGRLGFVDTADVYGPAVYGPPGPNSLADQYAAMPSLHVGWAILVAIGIIATTRSRWRWVALAHPLLTSLVVIVTANHFWLDGLVAGGLLALSLMAVKALSPRPPPDDGAAGDRVQDLGQAPVPRS